jgi:hypothetical protein
MPSNHWFWANVDVGDPDACWPWQRGKTPDGYGRLTILGRFVLSHRLAYELAKGPLADGMQVLHSCDNPPCCNPAHLSEGTLLENQQDKWSKGRQSRLCGEEHGQAKLTRRKVRTMRAFYAARIFKQPELADIYGISRSQVSRIIRGEKWRT